MREGDEGDLTRPMEIALFLFSLMKNNGKMLIYHMYLLFEKLS